MNNKNNSYENGEIPLGFGFALAQNMKAMYNFTALPKEEQENIIFGAKNVSSKQEMQSYVDKLSF